MGTTTIKETNITESLIVDGDLEFLPDGEHGVIFVGGDISCAGLLRVKDGWSIRAEGSIHTGGSIRVESSIHAGKSIRTGRSIHTRRSIRAGRSIHAGEAIDAGWSIDAGEAIYAGEAIDAGGSIDARGSIHAGKYIHAGLSIHAGGAIDAGLSIHAGEAIDAGWSIHAGLSIYSGGAIDAGWSIDARGSIETGEYCFSFRFDITCSRLSTKTCFFWREYYAAMPPFSRFKEIILPNDKCWDALRQELSPYAAEICKWDGWHPLILAHLRMFFCLCDFVDGKELRTVR